MMKSLSELHHPKGDDWLLVALKSKKAKKIETLKNDLIGKCKKYDNLICSNKKPLPNSIFDSDNMQDNKTAFLDFYINPPKELKNLLTFRRREHHLTECPYCGNPTEPDTLDHFIPKELLAEFAIYPNNLVPQCRGCAPIKGKKYFSDDEECSKFIHPIYSSLLEKIGFKIEVHLDGDDINFNVIFQTTVTDELEFKSLEIHIKELKIKERIIIYSMRKVQRWKREISNRAFNIETILQARINEYGESALAGNWEVALCKGLLENPSIIEYLNSLSPSVLPTDYEQVELFTLNV